MAEKGLTKVCATAFDKFMKEIGLARRIGADSAINDMAKEGLLRKHSAMDILAEVSLNGLLSGTGTPFINLVSGVTQSLLMPTVRLFEAGVKMDSRIAREALSMYSGAISGYTDFMHFFRRGWSEGMPLDIEMNNPKTWGMSDKDFNKFLAKKGLNKDSSVDQIREAFGDEYDYITKAVPSQFGGELIRYPTRLIVAIDEGMKAMFRRQKYNAMAYRKALELADGDPRSVSEIYQGLRRKKLVGEESEEAWTSVGSKDNPDLQELSPLLVAQDYAKMAAFQMPLVGRARQLQSLRSEFKPLILMIPFFKTPYNILKEGLTFTPGLGVLTGRAYKKTGTNFSAPMSKSEIAARQMIGFGAMATAFQLHEQGLITGTYPDDPNERNMMRDAGIPELSIKTPMGWVSYAKIEPLATVFGLVSDLSKNIDNWYDQTADMNNPEAANALEDAVGASLWSLKQNIMGKSFMEGLATAVNLMSFQEGFTSADLAGLGRVVVPFGALANQVAQTMDADEPLSFDPRYDRQATTFMERMQQRIPLWRESLPFAYGLIGDEKKLYMEDIWTGFRPFLSLTRPERTQLQEELELLGAAYAPVDKAFKQGLKLDNEELAQLRQISAGVMTPVLEELFSAPGFGELPESLKEEYFRDVVRQGRSAARMLFLGKNISKPNFRARYINSEYVKEGVQDITGFLETPEKE